MSPLDTPKASMAGLSFTDRQLLEELFGMETGYVLNFTNRTFEEFFLDEFDVEIFGDAYNYKSGSKANRLRAFWRREANDAVAESIALMLKMLDPYDYDEDDIDEAWSIVEALRKDAREPVLPTRAQPGRRRDTRHEIYEVALSFAGEQRDYVRAVADALDDAGVSVFFDENEDLWGEDLTEVLGEVYGSRSNYVVIFVSKEYLRKPWTTHERQHALAGRLQRQDGSVLPARFDDLELPGLPSSVGYLDIQRMNPKTLCKRILKKLGRGV